MEAKNQVNKKVINSKGESKRINSAQKTEYLKALLKLKKQEDIIEKTISTHLENAKIDFKILQDIQRDQLNFPQERQKIFDSLRYAVNDVTENWKAVKIIIEDLPKNENLDVDGYKAKLYNLWQKIQEFHKTEFLETLVEEQSILDADLTQFNLTLHRYENSRDFTGSLCLSKNAHRINYIDSDSQDFDDVQNFNSLVAKTGHTQHWSDEDHLLFLKLRKKCKSIPALVTAIQNKCPDLSAKCIVNHEAWYKFYLKLREQQKKAVKEWREQKEFERIIRTQKDESDIQTVENITKNSGKIKEKLTMDDDAKEEKFVIENCEPKKKRELIKKWREEKENKCLMDKEQAKQGKQRSQILENRKKVRAQRLKDAVIEYKKRKALEADAFSKSIPVKNGKENIFKSVQLIKSFREQDKYYVEKRKKILSLKKGNDLKETKRAEKIDFAKPRVSTLLNSTKVCKEKCKVDDSKEINHKPLYMKNLLQMSDIQCHNQETSTN